jgi:hypothetical protein
MNSREETQKTQKKEEISRKGAKEEVGRDDWC